MTCDTIRAKRAPAKKPGDYTASERAVFMKNKQPGGKEFLRQFTSFTPRRLIVMLAGNLILALGVALFGKAGLGNHPFHTMLYAAGRLFPGDFEWNYTILQVLLNVVLFTVIFFIGRKHIGPGTIVNMCLLSSVVTALSKLLEFCGVNPAAGEGPYLIEWLGLRNIWQLLLEILATILISLGISLYQAGDLGAAPYDALPLVAVDHGKPFAPWRMLCDGTCLVATILLLLVGGWSSAPVEAKIGLGTVITVFCTGPFIRFFDRTISEKLAGKKTK